LRYPPLEGFFSSKPGLNSGLSKRKNLREVEPDEGPALFREVHRMDTWTDFIKEYGTLILAITGIAQFWVIAFVNEYVRKARLSLYTGDAVRLIVSPNGSVSKFHLMCNLVNKSSKTGTLHRLEAIVHGPNNVAYNFAWKLFYRYLGGGLQVDKESDPYPISVAPRDSKLKFVEFEANPIGQAISWPVGNYEFRVIGWVNRANRKETSNLELNFHTTVTQALAQQLGQPNPQQPIFILIPITEWS